MNEDFYAPETADITITRNGKDVTYRVRELSGDEAERLFNTTGANGKPDPNKTKGLDARIIATAVVELGASGVEAPLQLDAVKNFGIKLRKELMAAVMDINGLNPDDAAKTDQD